MKIDPVELTKKLISFKSITPKDDGAIEHIAAILKKSGFECEILEFGDKVKNLYAKYINGVPNLCFAGHVDVVPPGELKDWISDPFKPEVRDGMLYGRGAADMKGGVAAFIAAIVDSVAGKFRFSGSISALITSAEESTEEHGTKAILEWMKSKQKKIDFCIVGEPTSSEKLGDTIKIGRRGSATFKLICHGKQGHVAYPDLADNPIYKMVSILSKIKDTTFDTGNKYFQPSHCEITTIDVGNNTNNLIPSSIAAGFNVRYNNTQTPDVLYKMIDAICTNVTNDYKLSMQSSRDVFLSIPDRNTDIMLDAINKITGIDAVLSTNGGTSDAAFIKDICPVIEFGMINKTAHQVNECVSIDDIHKLTAIYKEFIKNYFYPTNKILNQINVIGNTPDAPLLA
ncbi:succinyl-diaminopimelate desuccinylase [Wolbachia endosymbiont of Diaphorina citri]|jgi:succinyl-diaminopimelate desuccinylase, proteobacterial clade|uniref:succinyl-diaminopimelate desuccinylase n=1 Tax=Wolbachia endosymbiont of Diaphorina citri TaxID=116598 RepID=UPI00031AAFF8|nr:succinyl-diaminopimelate desuccinylase [Wolbachia endosymbiont of Diaphorina citri]QJT94562.1 succinyl-diaminopimelate desuccinylase [Wolbachia endosymbiont of Diaphorina citri]QJT95802.1 succinyl-diaminopimelate desuccinylase [Wolbachia endosymbiont of Diaphorina citri]QJT97164.1 succinyl-diaminopimelate desuccinylase [Wolbachia endosymbiont of Diaphorina citri]QLK11460.1 succinyl-diaminopimelate desuccinylase [Wolbachia endosymbiont of Diaphorina citri]QXY87004.1 succinyl-diaminopimelate 